jgi:hypothetical protein
MAFVVGCVPCLAVAPSVWLLLARDWMRTVAHLTDDVFR